MVPRIYVNKIDIHTTDAGYHIRLIPEFNKESVVFCFYNSLTLAQCEFEGRYYGGGVSELVPSEFKKLAIPYRDIGNQDVEKLNKMFRDKENLETIVSFVNEKTIARDMSKEEVEDIEYVRRRLVERRMGKRRADR
jgi:adenine-specific DNA-methyltransferase